MAKKKDRRRFLVIIDMQANYPAARDEALQRRIVKASEVVDEVITLGYDGSGAFTVPHDPSRTIWKNRNDGGMMLYAYLMGRGLAEDCDLYLCGVNLMACVFETAVGLSICLKEEHGLFGRVHIVHDLCGDAGNMIGLLPSLAPMLHANGARPKKEEVS